MPDAIFADPRLAAVYDALDADRSDLDVYERLLVDELGARSVLDVGCGTGSLAVRLARRGLDVVGVDPAAASVDVARAKPDADRVRWVVGTVPDVLPLQVDAATLTGNVAQVFLTDADWLATLRAVRAALRPGGVVVLEARRPEVRAWEGWTEPLTRQRVRTAHGLVERWSEVTAVDGELVTFSSPTTFSADGTRVASTSTLRFRPRTAVEASLVEAGLELRDVRDAPDRPGLEWVYLARRPAG
ncbi:class I SAM-dependent methyltransferase [Desertihabitans brevis]|uniref:Class I SAM-dependent methyltransferase n=1 Tax=Desertihabitans brevis TaxID=2268447 RepID=A0A367YWE9_9ACTN|nr:class I SAM-dependent methyltransferase [Desertihabitans brevis]RCK69839.1 class I SAM-dependent methyltransferase [Desertihabitans brevis]